ncbi:MAG: FadR family transcriptional regulator [Micrococcales bacterium]|nr:FadR family transcriptional regulator [Micrococcales bacterium]
MARTHLVDAALHPVRDHMAFESCVEQLGSAIQLGIFEPGTLLPPERILSEKLGVSRATVREAISALRAAGFVSTTRGRGGGTVVEEVRPVRLPDQANIGDRNSEITDTVIFRRVIEPGACFVAASQTLSTESRSLLRDCLNDLSEAPSPTRYRQADARLHLSIASVCGSSELTKACSMIQTKIHQFLEEIPFLEKNIAHSERQHQRIVKSILDGDAEVARSVMEDHCDATAALLKGLLK